MGLAESLAELENSPKALAMRAAVAQRRFVRVRVSDDLIPELVRQLVAADDPIRTVVKNNPLPWDVQVESAGYVSDIGFSQLEVTFAHPTFVPVAAGSKPPLYNPTFSVWERTACPADRLADTPISVGG